MNTKRFSSLALMIGAFVLAAACNPGAMTPSATDGSSPSGEPVAEQRVPPPPVVKTVPAGTVVSIELLDSLASNTSAPGDHFRGRVSQDVVTSGSVAIPAGSSVSGVVTEAVGLKKIGGHPRLRLEFTELQLARGREADLHATYAAAGKSETKKDAATIGGSAAGGAILGRIIGHQRGDDTKGTVIGAVVGGAAGTAIAAKTKGQEVVLPSGHVIEIVLDEPIQVTVRS